MAFQPQEVPAGFRPSIPQTIPLDKVDPERQKVYGELAQAAKELEKPLELETVTQPGAPADVQIREPEVIEPVAAAKSYEPTEDDKREFVRSILAGKSYEKTYKLFGSIDARFVDRSAKDTEIIYAWLDTQVQAGSIKTDEEWLVELERFRVATELRSVLHYVTESGEPLDLQSRVTELLGLPRPMYEGLMEAGRHFEGHIDRMIEKATDPNFWPTGGGA